MSFNPRLNRDYWLGDEEPWSAQQEISWRFLKIVYLYFIAAIVQIGIPLYTVVAIGQVIRKGGEGLIFPPILWMILAVLMALVFLVGFVLAFFEWREIEIQTPQS